MAKLETLVKPDFKQSHNNSCLKCYSATAKSNTMENNLEHDKHHLDKYQAFCELYEIEDWQRMVKLYDIFELISFLPPNPTEKEKTALQNAIGAEAESGYLDYKRSNNTFELIMQWQEATENWGNTAIGFDEMNK